MISASTALAVFGLATLGRSHMIMNTPVPYGKPSNGPLDPSGIDFPCKLNQGFVVNTVNVMPLGSTQPLKFTGQAVHAGGSCQISITYDATPSKSSVFKVIHSIEGGCPARNQTGNEGSDASAADPDTYSFTIPNTLPTGSATLAWTWFNKVGNREMYMNCAPISITSSTTKREELVERDQAAYLALPDMFVANVGNGCTTADSVDTVFPNPGDSLENFGGSTMAAQLAINPTTAAPHGTGCAAATGAAVVATTAVASQATTTAVALSGGVFATIATSAAAKPTTTAATTVAPIATSAPAATSAPKASVASTVSSPATPAATGTTGTGSAIAAGTACTTEGMWNCIGGTSFQQCASGQWSVVQSLAAGTTCTSGQTTNINIVAIGSRKRDARRSRHVRRHFQAN